MENLLSSLMATLVICDSIILQLRSFSVLDILQLYDPSGIERLNVR